jgi:hypothetical protein
LDSWAAGPPPGCPPSPDGPPPPGLPLGGPSLCLRASCRPAHTCCSRVSPVAGASGAGARVP